jgi:hypothetical protein
MPQKSKRRNTVLPRSQVLPRSHSLSRSQVLPRSQVLSRSPVLQSFFDGYNASPLARVSAIRNASNIAKASRSEKPVSISRLNNLLKRLKNGSKSPFTKRNK